MLARVTVTSLYLHAFTSSAWSPTLTLLACSLVTEKLMVKPLPSGCITITGLPMEVVPPAFTFTAVTTPDMGAVMVAPMLFSVSSFTSSSALAMASCCFSSPRLREICPVRSARSSFFSSRSSSLSFRSLLASARSLSVRPCSASISFLALSKESCHFSTSRFALLYLLWALLASASAS